MNLTQSQQRIKDRRDAVLNSYTEALEKKDSVSVIVSKLAKKYKVTEVTIYADLKKVVKKQKTNEN